MPLSSLQMQLNKPTACLSDNNQGRWVEGGNEQSAKKASEDASTKKPKVVKSEHELSRGSNNNSSQ